VDGASGCGDSEPRGDASTGGEPIERSSRAEAGEGRVMDEESEAEVRRV